MIWNCPLCNSELVIYDSCLKCSNNHSFDIARQGYVNLLPVQKKHSKNPGDSQMMIQARNRFLQQGFYEPLAQAISEMVDDYFSEITESDQPLTGLDLGGGDGYFSSYLNQHQGTEKSNGKVTWWLSDISKEAVKLAAKRFPKTQTAVANSLDLPVVNQSVDCIFQAFAPASDSESDRVLSERGIWIRVYPGTQHLQEMRSIIFKDAQPHKPWPDPEGFERLAEKQLNFSLRVESEQNKQDLLAMTPMYWRSRPEDQALWLHSQNHDVTANFVITCFKRHD
ncbi:putative RNA methyltransferase [Sessilibacter corallicola]|uniref:23S rRNA (Guanine(745)-N(1))-methyltransferase n=1 Tax=Sessilibacter corallicola TaxID=2904075 RepID=A0ABQ0A7W7_9GAMM